MRPRVELRVVEVDTPSGQELVAGHELDLAVVRPGAPVRGLRARPWRHDRFVVALPPGIPSPTAAGGRWTSLGSPRSPGSG